MSATISVRPDALHAVGLALQRVAADLERSSGHDFASPVGDPVIAAALLDVQHDWSKKRAVITKYLSEVGSAARSAADAYASVESAIVAGARIPGCAR